MFVTVACLKIWICNCNIPKDFPNWGIDLKTEFNRQLEFQFFGILTYTSRILMSLGSYGYSAHFLQRSRYISLNFYVLNETQNIKCVSYKPRALLKWGATGHIFLPRTIAVKDCELKHRGRSPWLYCERTTMVIVSFSG